MYINAGKVYVFDNGAGTVKVGCSKNVEQRCRTLETQSGKCAVNFYCTKDCSNYHKVETETHKILKEFRTIGEWFSCSFEIAVKAVDVAFCKNAEFDFEDEEIARERGRKLAEDFANEFLPEPCCREQNPADKLDLEKWVPSIDDECMVLDFLLDWYEGTLETADEEMAQDYLDCYNKVKSQGIVACKDDVQSIVCEIFWAVDGEIEKYYAGETSWLEMMNLTILKDPVQV